MFKDSGRNNELKLRMIIQTDDYNNTHSTGYHIMKIIIDFINVRNVRRRLDINKYIFYCSMVR